MGEMERAREDANQALSLTDDPALRQQVQELLGMIE
jgi:hypothetical protein